MGAGQEGKAKHAKAKHETSYKEMAIYALQQVGRGLGVGVRAHLITIALPTHTPLLGLVGLALTSLLPVGPATYPTRTCSWQ